MTVDHPSPGVPPAAHAGRWQQDDRRVGGRVEDVMEQIEERRLGPVDVVDDEDERATLRERAPADARAPQKISGSGNWVWLRPTIDATRATTRGSATRLRSLFRAASGRSSSWISAAPRTTSTSGQNVMPSP